MCNEIVTGVGVFVAFNTTRPKTGTLYANQYIIDIVKRNLGMANQN